MSKPLYQLDWQRWEQPVLSGMTTNQDWCRVTLYSPTVLRMGDTYKMWYLGNRTVTRTSDMDLGYAESPDGLTWTPHPDNPILSGGLPWGRAWQTPHVIFDSDENLYKMWFVMADSRPGEGGRAIVLGQKLGYATSSDGLAWEAYSESIYPSGRGPCVLKEGPNAYRMWMCSSPSPDGEFGDLVGNIYHFESTDGIAWTRDPEPMIRATETRRSVVYPSVLRDEQGYTMWYGCHVEGGIFEIFCSTSEDGLNWTHHLKEASFPATRDPNDFDGRYTSTPCVLDDGDRYLMYYSARDWGNLYRAGDGTIKTDGAGIYRHIGVAVCPKE